MSRPAAVAIAELAPSGTLRAAINFGNPVLATKDAATGEPRGISVDLARELATRLGVPVAFVKYSGAGKVTADARANAWDVAFVAIDPARAVDMDYSTPYVLIEGAYAVPKGSPIRANADVDRAGHRVVVAAGSAYDLYLSRELKVARLVRTPTSQGPVPAMLAEHYEVAAGVKQQLEADARRLAGVELLDGRFMVIRQAIATPKGRSEGARFLAAFVEEMKASGFVRAGLEKSGVEGAIVAPSTGERE
jgi:polar amino acid transport system substrate-binding protein